MKRLAETLLKVDSLLPLKVRSDKTLICFYFHKIFPDNAELNEAVDIQQGTDLNIFRIFIEYFLEQDYRFIRYNQIENLTGGKNILITFDDGYFNNSLVLPLLEQYNIPALFFVSTEHIIKQELFWWDVLFHQKISLVQKDIIKKKLKKLNPDSIRNFLISQFGETGFKPGNDLERPFSPSELKDFANHPLVNIGNHTKNHANLSYCSDDEIRYEFLRSQDDFLNILGFKPDSISYPNGSFNKKVLHLAKESGFKFGFTTVRKHNNLPLDERDLLSINRFIFPRTTENMVRKYMRIYENKISIYNASINLYDKLF